MSHYHYGISPFKFGLLGGIGGFLQGYGMNQQMMALQKNKMDVENLKAQNNRLLKMMEMESRQRAYTADVTDENGNSVRRTFRNVMGTDGSFTPQQIGTIPLSELKKLKAGASQQIKTLPEGDQAVNYQFDPNTGEKTKLSQGPRWAPQKVSTAEDSRSARAQAKAIADGMKQFDNSYQKDKLLSGAGITGLDPSSKQARDAYRDALKAEYQNDATLPSPPKNAQPSSPTSSAPDGKHIKYDKQGNPWVLGPDGKPVPYNPQADNAPLAMDTVDPTQSQGDDQIAATQGPQNDYDPSQDQQQDVPTADEQNQQDDQQQAQQDQEDQQDQQQQGLLG